MIEVKFANKTKFKNKTINFSSKEDLLQYISKNWSVQQYQIILDGKYIKLTNKFGETFAIIGIYSVNG